MPTDDDRFRTVLNNLSDSSAEGTSSTGGDGRPKPIQPGHGGSASVLVVDDEADVRLLVRRFLESAGHVVVEAPSGRDALMLLRQGSSVHALITDLKMADGSGGWLMAQLGYEFPDLLRRTVIISGDAASAATAHVSVRWKCPVVGKPLSPTALLDAIASLPAAEP
ncbi:MAG: response regulator [Gemmatimonadaceae bacterium]|nr:response regulator [Gemmatimonadaceae bacterium]